ncbi:PAS domain S-box protein [Parabacteroides sp. TM07-1AC]|nr:PAS domain S-box protein [Parabacteroides sp. TM07-1AC]
MDTAQYKLLLDAAQVGWWEIDFEKKCYICSDYLVSLLDLDGKTIPAEDFLGLIREDYRARIANEFAYFKEVGIYEQTFPIETCYGTKFVRTKICKREVDADGNIYVLGILQLVPFCEVDGNKPAVDNQVDSLLRHLNTISRALHSFIQTNDLLTSIQLVLTEILFSIDTRGRACIMEYSDDKQTISCTYEVCSDGVFAVRSSLQNIPVSTLSWSTRRIRNLYPVMINNLDELPEEAAEEKKYLKRRGVLSFILIPLIIKKKAWGYIGIDIVDKYRMWNLEDYQWLSSIANIISIITKMARINEALDRGEKLLRNIYTNIPVGIELYDKDGFLVDINNKDVEIFGLASKRDVLGINIFDNPVIPEDILDKMRKKKPVSFRLSYDFTRVSSNGYFSTNKGGAIDLITKVSMLYDNKGELINYLFINLDNTDKTIAYNRIEEFEYFFTLVSRYAKVGYAKFDLLTREGFAISQWYQNLGEKDGTPLTEIIGTYKSVHPEDRAVMLEFFDKVERREATSIRKELRIKHEDGWKWIRVNVMCTSQEKEQDKIEMICVNYDITELKETEQQREKAEELDRLKSAFLANMSHEIRTPLNAIVGFSTLLVDAEDREEQLQFVEIIQKNNELLLQLISDVLDLAKIEANTIEFKPMDIELKGFLDDLVKSMKIKIHGDVELRCRPGLEPCVFRFDHVRLSQLFSNFVNNAIKHTAEGSITLAYELRPDEIEFSVTDTGEGMSEEVQLHVFDRFYKGNDFKQGTGLGLSICKSIVEQQKGKIGVSSEIGKGSRFWFILPR